MRAKLEVNTREGNDDFMLTVSGDLDMDSSPRLLEAIRAALKRSTRLELDLKGVSYVDSSGIAILIQGFKLARKQSATYMLLDPSPQLMAVIELSQLRQFFVFKFSEAKSAEAEGGGGEAAGGAG